MIYVISDVHGDKKQVSRLLSNHNVINDEGDWSADASVLVVNGDSTDRGPDGIGTLEFFYKLSQQAEVQGGRLIHIMGNHDALILNKWEKMAPEQLEKVDKNVFYVVTELKDEPKLRVINVWVVFWQVFKQKFCPSIKYCDEDEMRYY